jgi:ZIP family zinc transporter
VIVAAFWGLVGGVALLIGALIGLRSSTSQRTIGLVMAFGSGVLISALTFELTRNAYDKGGVDAVAIGLAGGALAFFAGDVYMDRKGGQHRKRSGGEQSAGAAPGIVLGALLDGIPESIAIGLSLLGGRSVSAAVVAAVFLSNIPESLSAATGLQKAGKSSRWIMGLWGSVAITSAVAAAAGYALLGGVSANGTAAIDAFAAGAILTMLADTMMPEAFENGGSVVGLMTVLGFAAGFLLSTLE